MRVRIIQQGSGPGSYPLGTVLDVDDETGAAWCSHGDSHSTPFAVPVVEERKAETAARPDPAVEVRAEVSGTAEVSGPALVATSQGEDPSPPKRGPGRPPGSKNAPK